MPGLSGQLISRTALLLARGDDFVLIAYAGPGREISWPQRVHWTDVMVLGMVNQYSLVPHVVVSSLIVIEEAEFVIVWSDLASCCRILPM